MIRMYFLILVLMACAGASPVYDPPLPLPPADEEARVVRAETHPEEDTVMIIERELEAQLGLPHRAQIPVSLGRFKFDEKAKVISVTNSHPPPFSGYPGAPGVRYV
ncbi:hypothetical protein J6590_101384 [Homalodisca vitripennis]|nr:hypothetical protein J6590_101384 [Homalodisca vitripennis]